MREAKGILSITVGLVLLMQAGTTVAYADDRGQRGDKGKSDNKAQVSTKSSSESSSEGKSASKSNSEKSEAKVAESSSTSSQGRTNNSPPGNNGTIKIHEVGTAQSDHRNEPKVCDFYIDGFNFDSTSSGQWRIDGQGQTSGSNFRSGSWGPSDSAGNWRTTVIARLPDGHYKAAAWQVMPSNPPGGEKTKVFKVECGQSSSGDTGGHGDTTVGTVSAAISNAVNAQGQLAAQIIAAQNLLASGTLTVGQQTALTNAINAAIAAQAELAAMITAAQNALNALNTAINSGNAAQIAAAQSAAQQATTNLNAAANTAAQANLNLNATIGTFVSAGGSQTNQTTTTTGTTNATTPPIVLGVQTLPAVSGGETSRATQNAGQMMQGVQGLQTLPSTSTGTQFPLAALGGVLMSVGAWLLRKPARRNDS